MRENISISNHGYQRMKERNGWSIKTSERMIARIYESGKHPNDLPGFAGAWARQKQRNNCEQDKEYIIYGSQLYIFANKILVTTYNIPSKSRAISYLNY